MLSYSHRFEAIGTTWDISTDRKLSKSLLTEIHQFIDDFDQVYSRFRSDSIVSQVAKQAGTYTFPENAVRLFDFYKDLYSLTDGKVTPLIGDMLVKAGYDAKYSFVPQTQEDLPPWDDVLSWQGSVLHTKQPITLDIGAAGKGYLVDMITSILDTHSFIEYVIDASGDLRHRGSSENRVGLEHPLKPGVVIGVVDVQNRSLCASASNRRAWGNDLHHIFNPLTKNPVRDIIATWVIADETMVADGLATALFFVDPSVLHEKYIFQYVRMHANGAIDYSHDFKGELF